MQGIRETRSNSLRREMQKNQGKDFGMIPPSRPTGNAPDAISEMSENDGSRIVVVVVVVGRIGARRLSLLLLFLLESQLHLLPFSLFHLLHLHASLMTITIIIITSNEVKK